jgi:hypothetical protein
VAALRLTRATPWPGSLDDPAIRAALLLAPAWGPAATANNPQPQPDWAREFPHSPRQSTDPASPRRPPRVGAELAIHGCDLRHL